MRDHLTLFYLPERGAILQESRDVDSPTRELRELWQQPAIQAVARVNVEVEPPGSQQAGKPRTETLD